MKRYQRIIPASSFPESFFFNAINTIITLLMVLIFLCPAIFATEKVNNALYQELLAKHVKDGVVSYKGFKNDEKKLDRYLKHLEKTNPDQLGPKHQFAYYINAYNAWTIKLVLTGYPGVKSIKELKEGLFGSPWKRKICRINGKILTLDEIEHEILRPRFKDPRVHFAINCASVSCPKLWHEPFDGDRIDKQLDDTALAFINNPEKNYVKGNALYASKIFHWFSEDFNNDILTFFLKYAEEPLKKLLEEKKSTLTIKYLKYDWGLNGK